MWDPELINLPIITLPLDLVQIVFFMTHDCKLELNLYAFIMSVVGFSIN